MTGGHVFTVSAVVWSSPVWLLGGGPLGPPPRTGSVLILVAATILWGRRGDLVSSDVSTFWNPTLNLKEQPTFWLSYLIPNSSSNHFVFVIKNGLSPEHEDPQHPGKNWGFALVAETVMKAVDWCWLYQPMSLPPVGWRGAGVGCLAPRAGLAFWWPHEATSLSYVSLLSALGLAWIIN